MHIICYLLVRKSNKINYRYVYVHFYLFLIRNAEKINHKPMKMVTYGGRGKEMRVRLL